MGQREEGRGSGGESEWERECVRREGVCGESGDTEQSNPLVSTRLAASIR